MRVAIVILNWNGRALLARNLPALIQHSSNASLYMIDNASTDDSVAFVQKHHPEVSCIVLDKNHGFAQGYNIGLQSIDADLYCLLNNDVEVTPHWLDPVCEEFTKDTTAIAQPLLLDQKNKAWFEYAGAAGGYLDRYGFAYCRGRIFETLEKNTGQYSQTQRCFWASGACFFIRAKVWKELGGFDADFFMHQEEIDLCWRAFNIGYTTKVIGRSNVYHQGAASLAPSPQKTYLNHRNTLWMLQKNLPAHNRFQILFTRLVLDGLAAGHYLLKGASKNLFMVLKAHAHFYWYWTKNENKRKTPSNGTSHYKVKSIVWNYFLLKKSKFSALKAHKA